MYYATIHETALNAPDWDVLIEVPLNLRVVCSAYCVAVKFLCNTRVKYWMANIIRILSMASSISHVRDDSFGVRRGQNLLFEMSVFRPSFHSGQSTFVPFPNSRPYPSKTLLPDFSRSIFADLSPKRQICIFWTSSNIACMHDRDVARQI